MKHLNKFLLLAGLVVGSTNAFGALVQCSPSNDEFVDSGVLAAPVFTCSPSALAGNIAGDGLEVIGIRIIVEGTGQKSGGTAGTTYGAIADITNNAALTNPADIVLSCVAGGDLNSCVAGPSNQEATTAVGPVDQFGAFTVTVTGLVNNGFPLFDNATATVSYEAITRGVVPEPSTFVLLGSALLGLGFMRRRK